MSVTEGECEYVTAIAADRIWHCCMPTLSRERYCDAHVHKVHKRTDAAGNILPDDPRAVWLKKAEKS